MTSEQEESPSPLPPPFFLHVSASEQDLLEAISLTPPVESPDGSFFLGIVSSSGSSGGGACHVHTPWCTTATSKGKSGRGRSSELVFQRREADSDEFAGFLESLRDAAVTKLFGSQGDIFEEEVSREDIDANFVPPSRTSRAVVRVGVLDTDGEESGRMRVSLHIAGIKISGTRIWLELDVGRPRRVEFESDQEGAAEAGEEDAAAAAAEPCEVTIDASAADSAVMKLKDRRNVHLQMYREAKSNAEKLREKALMAYLELLRVRDACCISKDRDFDMNNSDSDVDEIEFI